MCVHIMAHWLLNINQPISIGHCWRCIIHSNMFLVPIDQLHCLHIGRRFSMVIGPSFRWAMIWPQCQSSNRIFFLQQKHCPSRESPQCVLHTAYRTFADTEQRGWWAEDDIFWLSESEEIDIFCIEMWPQKEKDFYRRQFSVSIISFST